MFTITDAAADKAKEMLKAEGKENFGLRVYTVQGGGWGCGPSYGIGIEEQAGHDDEVVEKNGLKVFIDAKTSSSLSGMSMDFVEEKEGSGFVLKGQPAGPARDCSSCGH